jgi:hypothetical protein
LLGEQSLQQPPPALRATSASGGHTECPQGEEIPFTRGPVGWSGMLSLSKRPLPHHPLPITYDLKVYDTAIRLFLPFETCMFLIVIFSVKDGIK